MSKPTYYASDAIKQIDEWYYEKYEPFRIWRTDNKFANRIEFSVEYNDLVSSDGLVDIVIEKIRKEAPTHDQTRTYGNLRSGTACGQIFEIARKI